MCTKKYYKLVTPDLKSVCSQSKTCAKEHLAIQYKIRQWVEPDIKESVLFVFETIEDVRNFKNRYYGYSDCIIFEVEIGKKITSNIPFVMSVCGWGIVQQDILKMLKKKANKKKFTHLINTSRLPIGTIGTNRVKLIREIKMWNY